MNPDAMLRDDQKKELAKKRTATPNANGFVTPNELIVPVQSRLTTEEAKVLDRQSRAAKAQPNQAKQTQPSISQAAQKLQEGEKQPKSFFGFTSSEKKPVAPPQTDAQKQALQNRVSAMRGQLGGLRNTAKAASESTQKTEDEVKGKSM